MKRAETRWTCDRCKLETMTLGTMPATWSEVAGPGGNRDLCANCVKEWRAWWYALEEVPVDA